MASWEKTQLQSHPLDRGVPPAWASGWGEDRQGPFVEMELSGATQRMRWIPPGSFQMGSPGGEPGHYENEGPCHRVTLTQGFWLGETPCTQELWQAVMGSNPSHFEGLQRPVETVSISDVQDFLVKASEQDPEAPGLSLPTEAQWEYACRAGGFDPQYNSPWKDGVLDSIAWYEKNSGKETHAVKDKQPNRWGLHDMLGNVWEMCADYHEGYTATDRVDPFGKGSERVYRGGSCWDVARGVRPAYRNWWVAGLVAGLILGFRLSRGHAAQDRSGIGGADGA
ncbi:MAG: formylglycine-generating enzyme family protein [bacterium]|nr:formylglycine-generating enzyme family protein [bacterium]